MKNKIVLISLLVVSILVYQGCKKKIDIQDNQQSITTDNSGAKVATTNIIYKDGMLCFKDQATFNSTYESLKNEMITIPDNLTLADGFDLGHPSQIEFENSFPGFLSARKRFNDKEKAEYTTGMEYFHHSIVLDDRINTFLNQKYQVKIGTNILYKKNRRLMFRIKNNDITALRAMENGENPLLYANVSTLTTGNWDQYRQNDYDVFRQGAPVGIDIDPCDAVNVNFSYSANPQTNFVSFTYTGTTDPNRTIKYTFGDGTTYGPVSSQIGGTNHTYAAAGSYTVIVEMYDLTLGCSKMVSKTVNIGSCMACFNVSGGSTSNVSFDASCTQISNSSATVNYNWDFGDGTTGTGKIINHTYTCNGKREVKLTISSSACLSTLPTLVSTQSLETLSYADGCNVPFNSLWNIVSTSNNRRIEYCVQQGAGYNWLGSSTNHTYLNAKSNYQLQNSLGWWIKTKSGNQLNVLRSGYVYKDVPSGCSCSNQISIGQSSGNQQKEADILTNIDADNPGNVSGKYYYARFKSSAPYYVYFRLGSTTYATVTVQ
jgi:PKD repeat protein